MPRIYAPVDDPILKQIDDDAKGKGISGAQWVSTAIDSFLHQDGADLEQLHRDLERAMTETGARRDTAKRVGGNSGNNEADRWTST